MNVQVCSINKQRAAVSRTEEEEELYHYLKLTKKRSLSEGSSWGRWSGIMACAESKFEVLFLPGSGGYT